MWWSDDEWSALLDEGRCGMCADASLVENEHSLLVAETDTTWIRLSRNQAHRGYSVVVLREHVTDMTLLGPHQLARFWEDVRQIGLTLERAFVPRKIDYLVMGHRMPHLHCHVLPHYENDDPLRNVDISDGPVVPTLEVLRAEVEALRAVWASS